MSAFRNKEVFLVGGPGGVGKTTIAATLAIKFAIEGHRTIVLTVDPAKRLAQALGFREGFSSELERVMIPDHPEAKLSASMLDTQRYFDRIIDRFATRPAQKEKILNNPLYRIMVESLGGTHEYAAMERLLEFSKDSSYDRVVVDTPPSSNAMDLLSAPQRLADFMDNAVLKWFQGSRPVLQIFRQGTKIAMKMMQTIFGADFMAQLSSFFDDLEGMQAGFRERNLEVIRLLKSDRTAFLLVTTPTENRYRESSAFLDSLDGQEIPLSGIYLNQVDELAHSPGHLQQVIETGRRLPAVQPLTQFFSDVAHAQIHWIEKFRTLRPGLPLHLIKKEITPLHDVASLSRLGKSLVS